ncbi:MAG TPA: gliding motility-associated C-terminal domain-containing protein, partial [Flavisolibacter sp.]|nr:gliding motility-associated C-terminal domain-containing protein [Flavisolibacter sp.]
FLFLTLCFSLLTSAQKPLAKKGFQLFASKNRDPFGTKKAFIKNTGQYDILQTTYNTGKVLYGYEGLGMPVLMTAEGLVQVQRKFIAKEDAEEESNGDKEEKWEAIEKAVTMKWMGANATPQVISEEGVQHHFTYGYLATPAKAFKKLTYKRLYPGIDLHYSFHTSDVAGVEFSFTILPGGNPDVLKWIYSGDVKKITREANGNLSIYSSIDTTILSAPRAYYAGNKAVRVPVEFKINGNTVQFHLPAGYDKRKTLVIDPFISTTSSLTGDNASIAKDIDFDYEGNIYVGGGGSGTILYMLAKYNAGGVLQWTFNGGPIVITGSPNWNFGANYGGFMVDKTSGKTYLSQGWSPAGVRVARLSTAGLFDNYITTPNPVFSEGWRLLWDCNNGNSQMLAAGGGSTSNLGFGVFSPPSLTMTTQAITGLPNFSQDIADAVIDPRNHEMYTIFSHGHTVPNDMYKHKAPYNVADKLWNKSSGFTNILRERNNRPYLAIGPNDNSINTLALNSLYLFYYDGKNLKAFDKATGNVIGTPLITTDTLLRQGGIIADECGNIFVGARQGNIKVYKFDGTVFNDAAAPDLAVAGFTNNNSVYDLGYDDARKMLYACGRGFVASFDIAAYCTQATYQLQLSKNCSALSVSATLFPLPPAGSTLDYNLYANGIQIGTNTTGVFTSLTLGAPYIIKALINKNCSGVQVAADFIMTGPQLSFAKTPACGSNGSLTITATSGSLPYSYSLNGGGFQNSNVFNNLTATTHTVMVKDSLGCISTSPVTIDAGINCVTATVVATDERCSIVDGALTVTAANGIPPYSYSIDGINFQNSAVFNNLGAGNYTVTVKDAANGTVSVAATIISISNNNLRFTSATTDATCADNNGSITATGTGGTTPFEFRIDNGAYQPSGLFANLSAGSHAVTIRDANSCTFSQQVIVPLQNTLTVDAGNTQTVCEGTSVLLNATSNGKEFVWSPSLGITNPNILQPTAAPASNITYYLTAKWGACTAKDSVEIFIKPAPRPLVFDTTICYGQSVVLNATGGVSYAWSPSTYLSNTTVSNPQVIKPASTITYLLHAVGTNNCASVAQVTVTVAYRLQIVAGNDTVAVENEALQLNALDLNNNPAINWLWSPADGLSNPVIRNPVFNSATDKSYLLMAVTPDGCEARDSIHIKVYKYADIFVATGFSPNGDGKNEVLKAVPIGIKQFKYFSVYNRWGQLVFTTSDASKGWDGRIGGQLQNTGVFVWIASGVDFKGRPIEKKGTTVLIR